MMSVIDKIRHYQRSIDKSNVNEERILHCIKKLFILPVTVQHLQETGVGRTVNNLRKYDGSIGNAAKALVCKWKEMVADEETTDEEDEACVPDVPESYNDYSPASPTPYPNLIIDVPGQMNQQKAGTSGSNTDSSLKDGNKDESVKSNDSKSSKSESQKHKHEKNKHSSRSETKSEKKSSSKDSRSSKSTSKKDEEGDSKDSDLNKSGSSKKNCDKLPSTPKSSKELQNDKHDHRKRKMDNSSEDKKNNKKRKNSQESDEDNEQHSSDSEKNNSKITYPEVQAKSSKENSESRNKLEHVYSPKDEDKNEKKSSHDKSKSNSTKSRSDESSSSMKDNEDKHRHRHKHKSDKDSERRTEKKKDSTHHSGKDSSKSKSHSSSSSKHDSENKDKSKKREHSKEKDKKEADTKPNKKEVKDKRIKSEINGDEGIDCNSGASFAEALGMCTMMPSRKRNNNSPTLHTVKVKTEPNTSSSQSSNKKMVPIKIEPTDSNSSNPLPLLSPNVKLEPLNVDLASTLPEISPNYKPLPYINHVQRKQEDKALTDVIYMKNQRTKVYSGNKSGYTSVPSLYELCIRVLIENIDALEFTGGVPYDIIKPVLERATADQLFMLEHYNPYLIEDTDSLWQFHCKREFRTKEREEMESWREMYMRCLDEREAKLKTLTANIKQSIDKSLPVRSTKLAYVDNVVKPPRNVLKKQAKYGTASSSSASDLKKKLIAGSGPAAATNISVPPPPMPRMRTSASSIVKKTKAPLMAKALQLIKGRYKR